MARGSTRLDSNEYDDFLAKHGKERELQMRHLARKNANRGYRGWHFGIDDKPVYTRDKDEFRKALDNRGLMMRDDVKRSLK